ncbi:glycosyltransferase family 2 protein [Paenibacillus sp. IITD108]|uniref:glycosyltransferase family 2 protein n=1 Tax=Paenibacillus sp. IITD108 TaxID=3116649 RepID=UPI002F41F30D
MSTQAEKLEQLSNDVTDKRTQNINEMPFFSVIIPTYNRQRFIKRAIMSVLKQTCKDYEIIVVDDGSRDRTKQIVSLFRAQVRYVYQKNQGPSAARNTGIRLAKGKYIAFLDSDDRFLPRKLEKNKQFLEANQEAMFLYSWYYEARRGRKRRVKKVKSYNDMHKLRNRLYKRSMMIRTSTVVVHHSCFNKIGLFNPSYRYSQDWDMWLRLACHYKGYCQKKYLAVYRRHRRKRIPGSKRHSQIRKNANKIFKWEGEHR